MPDLPTLVTSAPPALDFRQRVRAGLDMWLVDHGFIRDIYCNIHPITDGVWRSAQPAPHHLRWARRHGIRTIVNLRGRRDTCGSYILEREACHRLGLTLIDFPIRSRGPLEKPTLHAAAAMFAELDLPVLFHCKSGADRAGIMSTLYLFLHKRLPLRQALRHLSLRYGHIRHARTGLSDFFFESYLKADPEGRPEAFFDWVDNVYDPEQLDAAFQESRVARVLVNNILRRE